MLKKDAELEVLARDGDVHAFGQLIRRWDPDLRGAVWSVLRSAGGADDILQAAYEKALRSLPDFRGESSLKTWMHAICYRAAIDHVRYEGRRQHDTDALLDTMPSSQSTSTSAVARSELSEVLEQLDPETRALLMMVAGLGYSFDETAEITGLARGTVASKVRRARMTLRQSRSTENEEEAR